MKAPSLGLGCILFGMNCSVTFIFTFIIIGRFLVVIDVIEKAMDWEQIQSQVKLTTNFLKLTVMTVLGHLVVFKCL